MPELFQKTANYKLQQALHAKSLLLLSLEEKRWLKACLSQPEASIFLSESTRNTLGRYLAAIQAPSSAHLVAKGPYGPPSFPACWNELRQTILNQAPLSLSMASAPDSFQSGIPYKLEFSLLTHNWSLFWQAKQGGCFSPQVTLLTDIHLCRPLASPLPLNHFDWPAWEKSQQRKLHLLLCPDSFEERRRLLNALSCFEHKIKRDGTYQVLLLYPAYEEPVLLQLLYSLGRKINVVSPLTLREQLKKAATAALRRYQ